MALLEVKITASGSEGQGIGSLPSGKTCFVPGVFPGEVCLCELENETSKYAVCNAVEVIEASPDRTAPFRPADEVCGGLPFAALSYEAQLKFKQTRVKDCLTRIGGLDEALLNDVFKPILGAEDPSRYRNHMQYAVRDGKIGLLCAKSDRLGDYDGGLIEYEIFGKIKNMASIVFDRAPTRLFDGLVLRGSLRTKQILVEFVSSQDGPHEVIIRDAERYFETAKLYDNICNTCEENGYVLKKTNKNATSTRVIPIMIPQLRKALTAVKKKEGLVCTITPSVLLRDVKRACERAGVTVCSCHDLRRSFASLCYHLNISERQMMSWGGWASPDVMNRVYVKLAAADQAVAKNTVESFFTT